MNIQEAKLQIDKTYAASKSLCLELDRLSESIKKMTAPIPPKPKSKFHN